MVPKLDKTLLARFPEGYRHRGQSFVCRPDDIGRPPDERSKNVERIADTYAADWVLPPFIFGPMLERQGISSLESIAEFATTFTTSVTATAIRVMRMTKQPMIVVAHDLFGRKWQWPSITAGSLRVRDDINFRSSALRQYLVLDAFLRKGKNSRATGSIADTLSNLTCVFRVCARSTARRLL